MEEIKVGDYVRTKSGFIRKVVTEKYKNCFLVDRRYYNEAIDDYTLGIIPNEDILKHSTNIADLIEVGDWAIMNCYGLMIKKVITQDDIWELKTGNYQLLKILTKERFESESYEV